MRMGLALGSGAVRGLAHIAVINALNQEGIKPDLVAGSSVGALVGAYYCLNGEAATILNILKRMQKRDFLHLVDLGNPTISVIKGQKIRQFLEDQLYHGATFEQLKIPLLIAATNLSTHETEYLGTGSLTDAVMASISIPGIFPPYALNNKFYVDGGVLEPLPIDILFAHNMERVIAVNLNHFVRGESTQPPTKINEVLQSSFYMMLEGLAKKSTERDNIFVLEPRFRANMRDSFQFHQWERFFKAGESEILKQIPDLRQWLTKCNG